MRKNKKNQQILFKRFLFVLFFICLFVTIGFLVYNQTNKDKFSTVSTQEDSSSKTTEDKTINISAIGDIMCHNTQYTDAFNSKTDSYDFSYVFEDIAPLLQERDLVIGNLETTFAGKEKGYSSYPRFNTPEQLATDLKELRIDVLSTANNHSMDSGYNGVVSTIDELDKVGISHMGTSRSKEEQDTILIKEVNGIKIAFLSYTYGTNGIPVPENRSYCINLIEKNLMLEQIAKAKEQKADLIIANMHWGAEYRLIPAKEQEELANLLFTNGVDIIFGSHPHVLEPMEKKTITTTEGKRKDVFVIYSLGNFVSGQTKENTKNSIILDLTVTKKVEGTISIDDISYHPIYCYASKGTSKGFILLDLEKNIQKYEEKQSSYINSSNISLFQKELTNIQKTVDSRMKEPAE